MTILFNETSMFSYTSKSLASLKCASRIFLASHSQNRFHLSFVWCFSFIDIHHCFMLPYLKLIRGCVFFQHVFFQLLLWGHCQLKVHYVTNPMSIDLKKSQLCWWWNTTDWKVYLKDLPSNFSTVLSPDGIISLRMESSGVAAAPAGFFVPGEHHEWVDETSMTQSKWYLYGASLYIPSTSHNAIL